LGKIRKIINENGENRNFYIVNIDTASAPDFKARLLVIRELYHIHRTTHRHLHNRTSNIHHIRFWGGILLLFWKLSKVLN